MDFKGWFSTEMSNGKEGTTKNERREKKRQAKMKEGMPDEINSN